MKYNLENIIPFLQKYNLELNNENIIKALLIFNDLLTTPNSNIELTLTEKYILQCLPKHKIDRSTLVSTILQSFEIPNKYLGKKYLEETINYLLEQEQKITLKYAYYVIGKRYFTNIQNILTSIYNFNKSYIQKDNTRRINKILFKAKINMDNNETLFYIVNYVKNIETIINTNFNTLSIEEKETFINNQLINNTLKELGFLPNLEGYNYLKIILLHYQQNSNNWGLLTKIAKSFNISDETLSRAIHNSIKKAIITPANEPLQKLIFNDINNHKKNSLILIITQYIYYLKEKYQPNYNLILNTTQLEYPPTNNKASLMLKKY